MRRRFAAALTLLILSGGADALLAGAEPRPKYVRDRTFAVPAAFFTDPDHVPAGYLETFPVEDPQARLPTSERCALRELFVQAHAASIVKLKQDYLLPTKAPLYRLLKTNFPDVEKHETEGRSVVHLGDMAKVLEAECRRTIEQQIGAMSDAEKVAQLLFVAVPAQVENTAVRELVGKWRVGGVVLFAHNIERPEQVQRLNEAIVRNAGDGVVPFIAIDQEGGIVRRLRNGVPVVPSAMAIGATRSPEVARRAGAAVGSALRGIGFTMNFAPVLDVLTNPENTAIGTRAFSDDPQLVATLGSAFIEGQQEAGVIAVAKHFPGLGAVAEDSHKRLPRLDVSLELLRRREMIPFSAAFRVRTGAVMTAHVALPRVTGDTELPATLSPRILKDLLRNEMHFDGIVISDALQMDALARERGAGALALDAILAGSDMVLALGSAAERREVFDVLLAAYRNGRLPSARVEEALRRILAVKQGFHPRAEPAADPFLIRDIAERAVTLVPESAPLPVLPRDLLYIGPSGRLQTLLAPAFSVVLPERMNGEDLDVHTARATAAARKRRICVVAAANENQFAIASRIRSRYPALRIVFVNLGSPWRTLIGPDSSTLLTYGEDDASQTAAARVILGQARATGKSPIAF